MEDFKDELIQNIKILSENIWERKASSKLIDEWMRNFSEDDQNGFNERIHALFMLSKFMYFGSRQIRESLRALYRDLYKYPIIESIRKENQNTTDISFINDEFKKKLDNTRFLGVGNPSESGCHLLYYFRQENYLPKDLFIHSHQIFKGRRNENNFGLRNLDISHYIFMDDLCGSSVQASMYFEDILKDIKDKNPDSFVAYYSIFSTTEGKDKISSISEIDSVDCIFELDSTFKCFNPDSRYFPNDDSRISKEFAKIMCKKYGDKLYPSHPFGYKDGQLLIGFHHNTPDNSLPIFWYDEPDEEWNPIFRRYPKIED